VSQIRLQVLVVCAGGNTCALPLAAAVEVMRLLPTEAVAGAPPFVSGIAVIRGEPVPVVDLAMLLTGAAATPTRFVSIRVGERHLAVAVDAVVGIRQMEAKSLHELPPLLRGAQSDLAKALGRLDGKLLMVLETSRLLPSEAWQTLHPDQATP
jgi:purine-binding chemotaxis protein CheW